MKRFAAWYCCLTIFILIDNHLSVCYFREGSVRDGKIEGEQLRRRSRRWRDYSNIRASSC